MNHSATIASGGSKWPGMNLDEEVERGVNIARFLKTANAGVLVEHQLFTTLDAKVKRLKLPGGDEVFVLPAQVKPAAGRQRDRPAVAEPQGDPAPRLLLEGLGQRRVHGHPDAVHQRARGRVPDLAVVERAEIEAAFAGMVDAVDEFRRRADCRDIENAARKLL